MEVKVLDMGNHHLAVRRYPEEQGEVRWEMTSRDGGILIRKKRTTTKKHACKMFKQLDKIPLQWVVYHEKWHRKWCGNYRGQAGYKESERDIQYNSQTVKYSEKPWPQCIQELSQALRKTDGVPYNQFIVNDYRHESHGISLHHDNEKELVEDSPIAAWTFYEEED